MNGNNGRTVRETGGSGTKSGRIMSGPARDTRHSPKERASGKEGMEK